VAFAEVLQLSFCDNFVRQTTIHERLGRTENGGLVPLMPFLDPSLAARDKAKERDGRMVVTDEMRSDTSVDRGAVGARMA
jgi:hypothetical protein